MDPMHELIAGVSPETMAGAWRTLARLLPALVFLVAPAVAGRHYQRKQLEPLGQEPAGKTAEAMAELKRTLHFFDVMPFNTFILVTLILIMLIFFSDYFPGYLTLLGLCAVLGWEAGRSLAGGKKKLTPRILMWLGMGYLRDKRFEELRYVLGRLQQHQAGVDKGDLAWLKASAAVAGEEREEAIRVLAALPPTPKTEPLLLELLLEMEDLGNLNQRLSRQNPEQALKLLQGLPASLARDSLIVSRMEAQGDWKAIAEFVAGQGPASEARLLETLPESPARDELLLAAWHRTGNLDKVPRLLRGLGMEEGLRQLRAVVPEGAVRDTLTITLLGECGRYEEMRPLLRGMAPKNAVPLIIDLPACEERERLLMELWVQAGDVETVEQHFDPWAHELPIRLLRALPAGLTRDRLLAYYASYAEDHPLVAACLGPHLERGDITAAEAKMLAHSYGEMGRHDQALGVMQKIKKG
jgi:hypothetical protein